MILLALASPGHAGDTLAASTSITLDPLALPVTPAPAGSAQLAPLLGVNIHFTRDTRGLDAARSAGFTWVRMDLIWAQIETAPGRYNFSEYDRLLADLKARGMRALLILDYGNALYTGGANLPPVTSAAIQAFGDFAEAAARHFAGQGVRYEVWNEPNSDLFWLPEPDPKQYAALASHVIERVQAGDPAAEVTTGGLAGMDKIFLFSYLLAGGGAGADGIGCHPYREDGPETVNDDILFWRTIVARLLPENPPCWVTEWGYTSTWFGDGHSSAARTRQAVMAARELLTCWSLGFPLIIYYDLQDDGANGYADEHNFGLLAQDYRDKSAMQAVRILSAAADGRRFVGKLSLGVADLYALRLDGANDVVVALWASAGQSTVLVAPDTLAFTMLGERLSLPSSGTQRACLVTEAAGPVYLLFPRTHSVPRVLGAGKRVDDFDGDRCADPAQFTAATGSWTIWLSGSAYAPLTVTHFLGQAGDIAAVADYDGDRRADPAVYRPASQTLIIRHSADAYRQEERSMATDEAEVWLVPADYDGDRQADPALYSSGTGRWVIWLSGEGYARSFVSGFGVGADQPLAADFDGDRRADLARYAADGTWRVWLSTMTYAPLDPFNFGLPGGTPAAADFDGDGLADPGVVVSDTAWHIWLSGDQYKHYGPVELKP